MKNNLIVMMLAFVFCMPAFGSESSNEQWEELAARFLDEMPALSPVGATSMGDHRFDGQLDEVSAEARRSEAGFIRRYQAEWLQSTGNSLIAPTRWITPCWSTS